jgi:hypothetical protein
MILGCLCIYHLLGYNLYYLRVLEVHLICRHFYKLNMKIMLDAGLASDIKF